MPKKNVIKKSALTPTILVAGGAGFIGSHLCEALLNKGGRVIVIDNFNTGKEIHINHLLQHQNFALFNADLNRGVPEEIESIDYIFHFAGLEEYIYNKDLVNLDSLLTNSYGTKNLLDLAARSDAKFLLASSIDVYEGRMSQLGIENYFGKSTLDENKYSMTEAKRFAEAMVWEYQKKNNVDVRIARLPEVFGPRMNLDASGSLGGFIKDVIEGRDLIIYGEGTEKEYYIYIEDALAGIIKSLFNKGTKNNIYSLVPDEPKSVLEMAFLVKNLADRPLEIQYREASEDVRPQPKHPDTFNLKELGWSPRISFRDGIKRTFEWLGYTANENAFKPNKFIPLKKLPDTKGSEEIGLFSLQDLKSEEQLPLPEDFITVDASPNQNTVMPQPQMVISKEFDKPPLYKETQKKHGGFALPSLPSIHTPLFIKKGLDLMFSPYPILFMLLTLPPLIIFLVYPGISFYKNAKASIASLQKISESAYQLDSFNLAVESGNAHQSLVRARDNLEKLEWAFKITGKSEEYRSTEKLLSSLELFAKAGTYVSTALAPYEDLWEIVKPDTADEINDQQFKEAMLAINNAQNFVELAYADFNQVKQGSLPPQIEEALPKYEDYLKMAKDGLKIAGQITEDLPLLLGSTEPKRYLMVFQNSNEIRPTGGFIGSYAVVEFEKGKIKDLVIDDIYNPDGQIDIKDISSDPPSPIKELLGEDKLYIRNANWDPDFERSAAKIKDLYEEVTKEDIDGVIAIDLYFVQKLLEVTGPIYLTSYNEEINAGNLYERTQFHSEFNYTTGSDQKRSFLTVLGGKLLERFFGLQKTELPLLFEKLQMSLEGKHLMFYIEGSRIMSLISDRNWDGKLAETAGDYLYIVNSNMGGTKANYHVKNSYDYNVTSKTRDGLLRGEVKMEYHHTGQDESWPGGPYTNYVRVLTQKGTKLTGAWVQLPEDGKSITYTSQEKDEEKNAKEATRPGDETSTGDQEQTDIQDGLENIFKIVTISNVGEYTSYEYSFKLDPQEKATVIFDYDLPEDMILSRDGDRYELYFQKQPGTTDDNFDFTFAPPFGMTLVDGTKELTFTDDKLQSSTKIEKDIYYFINLR